MYNVPKSIHFSLPYRVNRGLRRREARVYLSLRHHESQMEEEAYEEAEEEAPKDEAEIQVEAIV